MNRRAGMRLRPMSRSDANFVEKIHAGSDLLLTDHQS